MYNHFLFSSDGSIGGICCYATVVVLLGHEDVAIIAPVGRPGVLHQYVRVTKICPVAHSQHLMVQGISSVAWGGGGGGKKASHTHASSVVRTT